MRPARSSLGIVLVAVALIFGACSGGDTGPAGPAGPAGDVAALEASELSCSGCHEATGIIISKEAQFDESHHGMGDSYVRGTSASCAGCHGSEGPMARIRAGLAPHDPSIEGVVNVSPMNCRTCHQIHTTYTAADWAISGNLAAVTLETTGGTYDRGAGNLCANCHQIRNELPVASGGTIEVDTTRFGTHHGAEAAMFLGEGALSTAGTESVHYALIDQGCPACHMVEGSHTYEPELASCQGCHADLDTFDRNGVQTEITALLGEVQALLVDAGIIDTTLVDEETGELDNRSLEGTFSEAVASAMWDYIFVIEDQSLGVHNPVYTKAMLEAAKAALEAEAAGG